MPTKVQNPPRLDANKNTTKFQDISELRSALRSQMPEILTEGLYISFVTLSFSNNFYLTTSIRNQLPTVHPQHSYGYDSYSILYIASATHLAATRSQL
jgi:hypothetical protein